MERVYKTYHYFQVLKSFYDSIEIINKRSEGIRYSYDPVEDVVDNVINAIQDGIEEIHRRIVKSLPPATEPEPEYSEFAPQ